MNTNAEHVWREADARYGKAWVRATHLKIRRGTVVKVVRLSEGGMISEATTDWGLEKRFFSHQLDFGFEFRTRGGEWISEADPRALRWLLRVRAELQAGKPPRHVGDGGRALELATVEVILRRNGWSERRDVKLGPPWG